VARTHAPASRLAHACRIPQGFDLMSSSEKRDWRNMRHDYGEVAEDTASALGAQRTLAGERQVPCPVCRWWGARPARWGRSACWQVSWRWWGRGLCTGSAAHAGK
jgi:hypothetical protein